MATALAGGFIRAGVATTESIIAADPSESASSAFKDATGAGIVESNIAVVEKSDVVFLAVKPQYTSAALNEIRDAVRDSHLIVSIVAGVPSARIAQGLDADCRIVRVMPNTPALVGCGASAIAAGANATEGDLDLVERLLSTVGIAVRVNESLLDAVTGLSGSGPAFGYQAIEALSDGGVLMGLPRDIAMRLAAQTLLGAAKMVLETGQHPGELKDAVTSPGGTTIAGLHALELSGFRSALISAVEAAALRSAELGES